MHDFLYKKSWLFSYTRKLFSDIKTWFYDIRNKFLIPHTPRLIPEISEIDFLISLIDFWYQKISFGYQEIIFWYRGILPSHIHPEFIIMLLTFVFEPHIQIRIRSYIHLIHWPYAFIQLKSLHMFIFAHTHTHSWQPPGCWNGRGWCTFVKTVDLESLVLTALCFVIQNGACWSATGKWRWRISRKTTFSENC